MVVLISFEGSIGAGKTTLLKNILNHRKMRNVILIPEPVELWENIIDSNGKNILDAFYNDKQNVSFAFQMIALISRFKLLDEKYNEALKIESETNKTVYLITERTILSDYYIFAKSLHEEGYINEHEMMSYKLWNDHFSKQFKLDKAIYVKTSIDTCLERISKRNRDGEKDGISREYLEHLNNAHVNFFHEILVKSDVIIVNNDVEFTSDHYKIMIEDIVNFITEKHQNVKVKKTKKPRNFVLILLLVLVLFLIYKTLLSIYC